MAKKNRTFETAPSKPQAKNTAKAEDPPPRSICENRRARHEYDILDTLECGMQLLGSEVKSLRTGKVMIDDAYGRVKENEVWLVNCDIAEYVQANKYNHEPKRQRKLLMHRTEISKIGAKIREKQMTCIPLKVYFNEKGKVKVLIGLGKGKKMADRREDEKKAVAKREMERAIRGR